jgi:hypothetical protein
MPFDKHANRFIINPQTDLTDKSAIDLLADDITKWVISQRDRVQQENKWDERWDISYWQEGSPIYKFWTEELKCNKCGILRVKGYCTGCTAAAIVNINNNMATYHLHRWSTTRYDNNPYEAPEAKPLCLFGYRDQETESVITTPIKEVDGCKITTKSGSIYILEDIDPSFLQWMQDNGIHFDPKNPIKKN